MSEKTARMPYTRALKAMLDFMNRDSARFAYQITRRESAPLLREVNVLLDLAEVAQRIAPQAWFFNAYQDIECACCDGTTATTDPAQIAHEDDCPVVAARAALARLEA